jgi:hypothetical protein
MCLCYTDTDQKPRVQLGQNGADIDVVVTDFEGFLGKREYAYSPAKLNTDPTFETCRCTSETVGSQEEHKISDFMPSRAGSGHSRCR